MAAPYRLVVSTVNCYGSVIIDRRLQQAVHYCTGDCQASKHGLDCMVTHHSVCVQLLHAPQVPAPASRAAELAHKLPAPENGLNSVGSEDYHYVLHGVSRIKKGAVFQGTSSLKDITGEAINLASGKMKEFSFEKLKNSTSHHVTYRKGRKVRPESFSRKSADFDLIYGHLGGEENCPPVSLLQGSVMEEKGMLSRSTSLEQNLNNIASVFLQHSSEENLLAQILEKHKLDSSSSGEDIKMCLDILLKCSEDLKKCTDIIKQCIKKKSIRGSDGSNGGGGSGSDSFSNPEMIYRNVMARLSSYLKKLPFEVEHGSSGHTEPSDLAELVSSLHGLQQMPFSPIFGHEQPPKYEDVVQSPPTVKSLPLSTAEAQASLHVGAGESSIMKSSQANTPELLSSSLTGIQQSQSRNSKVAHVLSQSTTANGSESLSATDALFRSCEKGSRDSMETLFIEEELDWDKNKRKSGQVSVVSTQRAGKEELPLNLGVQYVGATNEAPGKSIKKKSLTACESIVLRENSKTDPHLIAKVTEETTKECAKTRDHEEIDKLLMDLENFSQRIESTLKDSPVKDSISPPPKEDNLQFEHLQPFTPEIGGKISFPKGKASSPSLSRIKESNWHKTEEEDRALLLRILESIEDFAQELVEYRTGKGTLSKEKEVMHILQETLSPTSQFHSTAQQSLAWAGARDVGPTLLIQQTPEVIKVQSKQEKKPGTPPPAPVLAAVNSLSPSLPASKVLVSAPVSVNIPRFYFPRGLPTSITSLEETISKVEAAFTDFEDERADIYDMGKIAKVCNCPVYWKAPMFNAAGGERTGFVSVHSFVAMWRKLLQTCHDDASRFIYLLAKPGSNYLEQEDFIPLLQDVVDTHPGLTFLKDAPEFHSRYITTVIQRIFYTVNRSWSGRITLTELRRSNFLQTLALLEEEEDINQITDYFSYEHFYVIYCKFWELDTDHDLYIDQKDLARYNDHASSNRIIERIFSGAVTRGNTVQKEGRMSYADFVWFLISEEDKKNPTRLRTSRRRPRSCVERKGCGWICYVPGRRRPEFTGNTSLEEDELLDPPATAGEQQAQPPQPCGGTILTTSPLWEAPDQNSHESLSPSHSTPGPLHTDSEVA
ncbi:serine/threonine-protein phosphatase 2A regulatory subunit B'' subunit alpha isoform X2 [Rhinatrema bivittatum]|uniref:serine/threonine-protein phosphatase 2A regulatory subunit B'' subunit alpha isoform X2 n=1 Tax=Rhinatrema bivittatum TaxID=194408 RepID=UPI00112B674A|nr:serine/threonine-protein phosphatase 2A regulatory subunit B'' subunit alpha isoform X2 [Rhinatrema bivittatum]